MLKTKTAKGMIFFPLDIGYGSLTERNATGKSNVPLPPQLKLIQAHRVAVLQNLLCIFIVLGLMTKVDTNLPLKNKNSTSNPKNINSQPMEAGEGLLKPQEALTTYIGIQFTIVDDVEKIN